MDAIDEYNALIDGVIERLESLRACGVEYLPRKAVESAGKAGLFIVRDLPTDAVLTAMLTAMGLSREEVYITQAAQSGADKPGLDEEITKIAPRVIVLLGPTAAKALLGSEDVAGLRGRFHDYKGVKVMPSYDPASIIGRKDLRQETWADMQTVMKELEAGEEKG